MKRIGLLSLILLLPLTAAQAQNKEFKAVLAGTEEVPALSTTGHGEFRARISDDAAAIHFQLSYDGLEGNVTAAHIHLGQRGVNGGVSAFLCSPCPAPPAHVSGIITAAEVIGPAGQGIAAGEFAELVAALRNGTAYVNVHSSKFPGGEIRSQIDPGNND